MLKKGAMFGLDARIALAIFGALSVISGAALFSAIQHSKVVKFVTQMEEISKAIDEYRLTVGSDIVRFTSLDTGMTVGDRSHISALLSDINSDLGWRGPYLSGFEASGSQWMKKDGLSYTMAYRHYDMFDSLSDTAGNICPINDRSDCSLYIKVYFPEEIINNNSGIAFLKSIDRYIDGSDSLLTGKIKFLQRNNSGSDLVPFTGSNHIELHYSIGNLAFVNSH